MGRYLGYMQRYCIHCHRHTAVRIANPLQFNTNLVQVGECLGCQNVLAWNIHSADGTPAPAHPLALSPVYALTPHEQLPLELRTTFDEARRILYLSPKAAAVLLRSLLEELIKTKFTKFASEPLLGKILEKNDIRAYFGAEVHTWLEGLKALGDRAAHGAAWRCGPEEIAQITWCFQLINTVAELFYAPGPTRVALKQRIKQALAPRG